MDRGSWITVCWLAWTTSTPPLAQHLVHGALALHDSAFFKEFIQDREAFFEFLMQIGMRMGNHGQSRHADVSKKVANEKPTSK